MIRDTATQRERKTLRCVSDLLAAQVWG